MLKENEGWRITSPNLIYLNAVKSDIFALYMLKKTKM